MALPLADERPSGLALTPAFATRLAQLKAAVQEDGDAWPEPAARQLGDTLRALAVTQPPQLAMSGDGAIHALWERGDEELSLLFSGASHIVLIAYRRIDGEMQELSERLTLRGVNATLDAFDLRVLLRG